MLQDNSRFFINVVQPQFDNGAILCVIYRLEDSNLAFNYHSNEQVVKTDKYSEECSHFEFWLKQVPYSLPTVKFKDKCTSTN